MPYIVFILVGSLEGLTMSAVNFNMRLEAELKEKSYSYFGGLRFNHATGI